MEMTYDQYIQNPMGVNNAVYSQRGMFRDLYVKKLDTIMVREMGKAKYTLYKSNDGRYFTHMKVPSEVVPKFYYDVVVEYYTTDNNVALEPTLDKYLTKFYSNDPMFVYTFAHSFIKNGMFIEFLEDKMSKDAVKNVAKERNPNNTIGYVKSIYFAYLLIKQYGLNKKVMFDSYGEKFYKKTILDRVEHANTKVTKRKEEGERIQKAKTIEKRKAANSEPNRNTSGIKVIKPITNTRTTRTTKSIKTTSNIKRK